MSTESEEGVQHLGDMAGKVDPNAYLYVATRLGQGGILYMLAKGRALCVTTSLSPIDQFSS